MSIVFIIVGLAINLAPIIISLLRDTDNKLKIALVNIFLGWTVIGWFVALMWSLKKKDIFA